MARKEDIRLNYLITSALMIITALTLIPLFIMFYTSIKAEGTLTKKVSRIVVADFSDREGGRAEIPFTVNDKGSVIWSERLNQDVRKFSRLEFMWKPAGSGDLEFGLVDAMGRSSFVAVSKYAAADNKDWQKISIPMGDFNLKALDARNIEKVVIASGTPSSGTLYLDSVSLRVKDVTLINYIDVMVSGPFGRYFFNSFIISVIITFGNIIFCSMVAYAFARKEFPGRDFLFLLIIGSIMIPPQVLMVPMFSLMKNLGWLNTYWALIIPALAEPFNIFLLRQYIKTLPKDLEEAALIDGANEWQVLFRVIIPLSRPALAIVGINTFMGSWNTFLYPFLLTNTTEMRTLPVGLALYKSLYSVDWTHLMAASSITAIPVIIVFLCFQKHIIAGLTQGALKG